MDVDGIANVISFDVIVIGSAGQLGRACIHSFGLDIQCKTKSYHQCSSNFLLLKLCEENNFHPGHLTARDQFNKGGVASEKLLMGSLESHSLEQVLHGGFKWIVLPHSCSWKVVS